MSLSELYGQNYGLSFSYFLPFPGEASMPISPFSLRGVGIDLTRNFGLRTGITLYRMSGLTIKDIPYDNSSSLYGPNFTVMVPGELALFFGRDKTIFTIKGGGFVFYGMDTKLNQGNFDRAIRAHDNWDVVNSSISHKNYPGVGLLGGVEFSFPYNRSFGFNIEVSYLYGFAKIPLRGSYTGARDNAPLAVVPIDLPRAKVNFSGLEISIGVNIYGR